VNDALDKGKTLDPDDPGLLDLFASLKVSIGGVQDTLTAMRRDASKLLQQIHPFETGPFPITLTGGAGALDLPDTLGPKGGTAWDVHYIVASGFTAGTVTMFRGGATPSSMPSGGGTIKFVFAQAGELTYGKAQNMLMPNNRLGFYATGITGNVNILVGGVAMEVHLVPEYLI
jgi:hypothetical protein